MELVSELVVLRGRRLDEVTKGKGRALRSPEVLPTFRDWRKEKEWPVEEENIGAIGSLQTK